MQVTDLDGNVMRLGSEPLAPGSPSSRPPPGTGRSPPPKRSWRHIPRSRAATSNLQFAPPQGNASGSLWGSMCVPDHHGLVSHFRPRPVSSIPSSLDHLIFAGPDLDAAVAWVENTTGAKVHPGGRHPDWGTRNAILPLGPTTYLEIMGPDPDRPAGTRPRLFDLDALPGPLLAAWAAKGEDLVQLTARARDAGIDLGAAMPGQRLRPDGTALTWVLTDPTTPRAGGIIPFFIDWPDGSHPGAVAPAAVRLLDFHAEHPDPDHLGARVRALGVELDVRWGPTPALSATLQTPRGILTLV